MNKVKLKRAIFFKKYDDVLTNLCRSLQKPVGDLHFLPEIPLPVPYQNYY